MTDLTNYRVTDGIDDVLAAQYNRVIDSIVRGELSNTESLAANKTLTSADYALQVYTPTAARDVTLPAVGSTNHPYYIINASATYALTVKNAGGSTIGIVPISSAAMFASNGTAWYMGNMPYVAPSTSGNVLISNGTTWTSGTIPTMSTSSISPTTSNVTAAKNTRYIANVSGLTANRNFVLPAGTAGDVIELNISTGDDTYALIVIGNTGITINGGSAATEWSRLFITNESVQLVATSASNWQVMIDKRIPCLGFMDRITTAVTSNTASTDTIFDWNNIRYNVGDIADTTNDRFNIRRANKYRTFIQYRPQNAVTDQKSVSISLFINSAQYGYAINRASGNGTAMLAGIFGNIWTFAVGDYAQAKFNTEEANIGFTSTDQAFMPSTTWYQIEEIL